MRSGHLSREPHGGVTLITVFFQFVVCFPLALYLRFSTSRIAGAVQVLALFPLFAP